jgi:nucleotide-binding universal stress UspA family protein
MQAEEKTMFKRILIAIDGSELANRGLDEGLSLAASVQGEVIIVTVTEPWAMNMYDATGWSIGIQDGPEYRKLRDGEAEQILKPALDRAAQAGVKAQGHHVADRHPAEGIVDIAQVQRCDLIVMTSHGRRGMSRAFLGSQTAEVLAHTKLPVLVVR